VPLPSALRRRAAFWGEAITEGARWAWGLLDGFSRALAVAVLIAAVALPSYLTARPAWESAVAAGVLLLAMFGEGAYRVWNDAEARVQTTATRAGVTGLSLVDRLRLDLKRGEGFKDQTHQLIMPDAGFVDRVCVWHDGIYETLIAEGERNEAQRWLDDAPAVPEGARPVIGGLSAFPYVVEAQVKCLRQIIARLAAASDRE
jgi:hypothetical protein